jgi:DNA polymerase IV
MKIHIDLDCFFVSAHRTLDSSLLGIPVAVGGRSDSNIFNKKTSNAEVSFENHGAFVSTFFNKLSSQKQDMSHFTDPDGRIRGILTTASYEAREFGIYTTMSIREALMKCPHLIVLSPDMALYKKCSQELCEFLESRIPVLEQASIDEFYGDLAGWIDDKDVAAFIKQLQDEVKEQLNLPISIGAAKSKYTAKLATNHCKPYGTKVVYPHEVNSFIEHLIIREFPGIGRKTAAKLQSYGLKTLGDIRQQAHIFAGKTKSSWDLYERVCGIDTTPIKTEHIRKSIGISRTFDPLMQRSEALRRLTILTRHLAYAILKLGVNPTHYHLGISYELGKHAKKEITIHRIFSEKLFHHTIQSAFKSIDERNSTYALIRISISGSNFSQHSHQTLSLIDYDKDKQDHHLSQLSNQLRKKYGIDTIRLASEL